MEEDEFRKEMSVNAGMIFLFRIKYVTNRNGFLCRKQLFRKRGQGTECIRPRQWQSKQNKYSSYRFPSSVMRQHNLLQSCREAITPTFNTVVTSDSDGVMHALILTDT